MRSTAGVPHALKMTVIYELPFGRGQRFGTDVNRWLDGAIGGWSLNLTGRVQSGTVLNFGNVRVVGMTTRRAAATRSRSGSIRRRRSSTRCRRTSSTTRSRRSARARRRPTGYGALGPPTGRYLAPANGPDCIQVRSAATARRPTCSSQGPIFTRFDLNARKRFTDPRHARASTSAVDVLNLFNAINFNAVAQAGSGATINQVHAGLPGSERDVRSGRPADAAGVQIQLVDWARRARRLERRELSRREPRASSLRAECCLVKLTLLGTGTPAPSLTRQSSGYLLDVGGDVIVSTTVPARTTGCSRAGIAPIDVTHAFFSHLHYDHCLDYARLVLQRWDQGADRIPDLDVYGPPPIARMTEQLFGEDGVYGPDIRARIEHQSSIDVFRGARRHAAAPAAGAARARDPRRRRHQRRAAGR